MNLDRIRVLDLTRLLPGPYATQHLADLGADVVKIEPPDTGDYARHMEPTTSTGTGAVFTAVNRGKRSVTLNLKTEAGNDAFVSLAKDADVIIEGFRPGVADRLNVGYDDVQRVNEEIIYCSLTGFGQTGPEADKAGHDLNYAGLTGILDMTRRNARERPRIPGIPIADMSGGLFAAFAIVSALLSRELGDVGGTYLDISMTDAALSFTQAVSSIAVAGDNPRPGRTPLTGAFPWYDVYETDDERYVTLAALEEKFWRAFCTTINRPDLVDYHGTTDQAERTVLREELSKIFESRTQTEWAELCDEDVPVMCVRTPAEALENPQIASREILTDGSASAFVGLPLYADGEHPSAGEKTPALGEHTEEVLDEVGFDHQRLKRDE